MKLIRRIEIILRNKSPLAIYLKAIERFKRKELNKYITKKKWKKAINLGERLVKVYPENLYYHLKLAESYEGINNGFRANSIIEKGMKLNFNLNDMIKKIEYEVRAGLPIDSRYILLGGLNNAGFIIHKRKGGWGVTNYITKISPETSSKKEKLFYREVYSHHPGLKLITPKLVNLLELDYAKVSLITMEKIEGDKPEINDKTIQEVIEINNIITSIQYSEVIDLYKHSDFDEIKIIGEKASKEPFAAFHSFVSIHKEATNKNIFSYIYQGMKGLNYTEGSFKLIKRLEKVIIGKGLYRQIMPKLHFSLQHGDYFHQNFVLEEKRKRLYILDWGYMGIGPKWTDMAGFFGRLNLPFNYVNNSYLSNKKAANHLEPIEKIFFIYTLIVTWFIVLSREEFDLTHNSYLTPAIEHLEHLEQQINQKNDHGGIRHDYVRS